MSEPVPLPIEHAGVIAILRGLTPERAAYVGDALFAAGVRCMEVPLNSPNPFESIRILAERFGERVLVGAGTVLTVTDVDATHQAGGRVAVAPNFDASVVNRARQLGLLTCPGVATPSEAFAAIAAGASALKAFPCEMIPPPAIKAWRSVLPADTVIVAVGGISAENMRPYADAGVAGFGVGSSLFQPQLSDDQIHLRAAQVMGVARETLDFWHPRGRQD